MSNHVLIIDDEKNYLLILDALLTEAGYTVTALNDPEMAMDFLEESEVDLIVTDMKMPKLSGQDILETVRKKYPFIPVLIMTAYGSIDGAVEAMRTGAFDYITKPFNNEELLLSLSKAARLAELEQQNRRMRRDLEKRYATQNIVGRSNAMAHVLEMVDRVAPSRSTVLITGESGTGKELVAKAIHYTSGRKDAPFVSVNCSALNSGVLESELFGHEKGSFTGATARRKGRFELADKGTLFLDEISETTPELQVKLLRVLQERTFERVGGTEPVHVDIRLLAATNRDLKTCVEQGTFREDLYYRLNVVQIELPPLRERREDIPLLVSYFLSTFAADNDKEVPTFSSQAMEMLSAYEWPGNVRQLQNIVERCVVLASGKVISLDDLPAEITNEETQFKSAVDLLPSRLNLAETLEKIEAALIRRALARSNFVQVKAAEMLGLSKSLLQYKLKKYKLGGF